MLGRARCFILFAFALAFIAQLAVVIVYLPSSSINGGLLLDESAFPSSPALRVTLRMRPAANSSSIAALHRVHHEAKRLDLHNAPILHTPIVAVHQPSNPITVLPIPEKTALALSNLGPKFDLVFELFSLIETSSCICSLDLDKSYF